MWLSCSFPNTSAHAFTLSCGMLNTCPVVGGGGGNDTNQVKKMLGGEGRGDGTVVAHRARERW